ncbi:MAG: MBL fold metallo-hydrolase [Flavobacteriaceae bacterium]
MYFDKRKTIEVAELRTLLENKEAVHILDIRPRSERDEWHIPESEFVDVYERLKVGEKNLFSGVHFSSNIPVVTLCGAGKTSMMAMEQLRENGIEAYSLEGGMQAWTSAWNTAYTMDTSETHILQVRRTGKGCLSYVLGNNGEAVVIDASLDAKIYHDIVKNYNWNIKYVVDTHIHADHYSRSRELALISNAQLYLPNQKIVDYPYNPMYDNDLLYFGNAVLRAIHTPGHTHESYSFLVNEESLFSGDTLFTTGVGRPDLKTSKEGAKQKARLLYHSLQRLMSLGDSIVVYPGHTGHPVAFDGKLIGSTLYDIKGTVDMLQLNEEDFVGSLLGKVPHTPPNYEEIVKLNLKGNSKGVDLVALEAGVNRCAIS